MKIDEEFESIIGMTVTDDIVPTHDYLSVHRKTFNARPDSALDPEDYAKTDSAFKQKEADMPIIRSMNEDQFGDYLKKGPKLNNFGSGYVKSDQTVPDSDILSSAASIL